MGRRRKSRAQQVQKTAILKPVTEPSKKKQDKKRVTRIDMHTHTPGSDGVGKPSDFVRAMEASGIDGLVITDHHNTITQYGLLVAQAVEAAGFFVALGCEYSTKDGHCLVYGVDVASLDLGFYPHMQTVLDRVHAAGGIALPSHPYRGVKYTLGDQIAKLRDLKHAEIYNGQNQVAWSKDDQKAAKAAKKLGLVGVGGSDAHYSGRVGTCYTEFDGNIRTPAEMLEALRAGQCAARSNVDRVVVQRDDRSWTTNSPSWQPKLLSARTTTAPLKSSSLYSAQRSSNGWGSNGRQNTYNSGLDPVYADGYPDEDIPWWAFEDEEEIQEEEISEIEETEDEKIERWEHGDFFDSEEEREAIAFFTRFHSR